LLHLEGHPISFGEGFEPLGPNGGKMNEDVTLIRFLFNETKPFFVTEPFYNTVCNFCSLLKKVNKTLIVMEMSTLRARAKITSHFRISASAHLWLIPHSQKPRNSSLFQ